MESTPDPEARPSAFALSLVRDDVLFRIQRRLGLIPASGLGLGRRLIFWPLFAWLPIVVWAALSGHALEAKTAGESLLGHFGVHVRCLVALPLFILAEGVAHSLTTRLLPHFVRSGVVPEGEVPALRAALQRVAALRNGTFPWIAILAFVISIAGISALLDQPHEIEWAVDTTSLPGAQASERHVGFGAWWYLFVARPIFLTLLLGWIWRVVLMAMLFRAIAGLKLSLVPTHPDGAAGLGFLERLPAAFAPVVLGISAVLAGSWAHGVVYHGVDVATLRAQMIIVVVLVVVIFLAPMRVGSGVLRSTERQALLDYGVLVGTHGRLVHRRWIEGQNVTDDAVLGAPELGPVADTIALYGAIKDMRTIPMGRASVAPLILAAVLPMVVVLAIQVPVKDILRTLLTALL